MIVCRGHAGGEGKHSEFPLLSCLFACGPWDSVHEGLWGAKESVQGIYMAFKSWEEIDPALLKG